MKQIIISLVKSKICSKLNLKASDLLTLTLLFNYTGNSLTIKTNLTSDRSEPLEAFTEFSELLRSAINKRLKIEEYYLIEINLNFATSEIETIIYAKINNENQKLIIKDLI